MSPATLMFLKFMSVLNRRFMNSLGLLLICSSKLAVMLAGVGDYLRLFFLVKYYLRRTKEMTD